MLMLPIQKNRPRRNAVKKETKVNSQVLVENTSKRRLICFCHTVASLKNRAAASIFASAVALKIAVISGRGASANSDSATTLSFTDGKG